MKERWTDIDGYEGYYEVSNLGRVRSVPRVGKRHMNGKVFERRAKGKLLKLDCSRKYMRVFLAKDGSTTTHYVHRLVAKAYCENPDNKKEVNHIDSNRANNAADNLEWVTRAENVAHHVSSKAQLSHVGENHYKSKLTNDDVRRMRMLYDSGKAKQRDLVEEYGLTYSSVHHIVHRNTWKSVD